MAPRYQKLVFKIFITSLVSLYLLPAHAQMVVPSSLLASTSAFNTKTNRFNKAVTEPDSVNIPAPAEAAEMKITAGERRKLMTYLKQLNVPEDLDHYQSHQKLYYHLANVFARLRLYPLAMKCFLKARVNNRAIKPAVTDTTLSQGPDYLSAKDDSVVSLATIKNDPLKEKESKIIRYERICNAFNDGKTAIAYAMLFHVKQPVPGKRKIFHWANTGHTFITLIKYNSDSTFVSASFGFYPVKDQFLSATPLSPSTSATFRDDADHKWDEVLGKFISLRKFKKILLLTRDYAGMDYQLNSNNCTDFGINAATIAGIRINETRGKWPLGSGNNPAVTGQSILLGKFTNMGTDDLNGLFVDSTAVVVK